MTEDATEHLIARAMNLRCDLDEGSLPPDHLAQRILDGLSQPGVHRALVDLGTWKLLKWLDDPCPITTGARAFSSTPPTTATS